MELRHLRYFVMAAEEANISRAAERLNVSQPAVSRQIRDLEEELGVSLFKRERVGLSLTQAGQTALVQAKLVLRQAVGMQDAMRPFRDLENATIIRVAYLPTALPIFLTKGLLKFNRAHKDVCVEISEMSPTEQESALRNSEIDLALLGQARPGLEKEFSVEALHKTPVGIAVPEDHHLAKRKSVNLEELQGEPFVSLSEKNFPTRPEMMEKLFNRVKYTPKIYMKANSLADLLAMVGIGSGIAIVPMEIEHLRPARVVFLKLNKPRYTLTFSAVWKPGPCEPLVLLLISFLRDSSKY